MNRNIITFLAGLIIGMILAGVIVWNAMPGMMLTVHESNLGLDATVDSLKNAAIERSWKVPKIYDIQKSLANAGHSDMTPVKILSICQPHKAYDILSEDDNKKVTAIMPCRLAVYETKDGKVYISGMNIGMMSKMFGGKIATVMGSVAEEESQMIADLIKE